MYWHFLVEGIQGRLNESNHYFVRKVLEVCIERITKNRKGFYHRHHGTWLMVRSCTRSALALLAAAQHNDLKGFLPLDWKKAVIDVTAMLNFWQDESRDVLEMLSMVELLLREEDSADCQ
ncbi:hypothetical protein N7462_011512 [Penicillium macrosclerotiorum]|uniref:uncharacterized protein n=1 Tax=Penicillium macrosclerotiorum TaxID=303699 RepID=UPI0025482156|nr:uncharacterized protein N7462_011512 [Penicillium macrosclerotiorum]KAJ5664699.1 hypothetical protein N7462_011512 [Penicillium macrosclerotiorum]